MVCLILHNMFFFPHGFIDWFYVVFTNGFWLIPKFHGMVGGKLLLGVMSWMDWFEGKLYVDVIISEFFDTSNCWWGKTFTANHGFYHCGGEVLFLQFPLWKMTFFNIGINKLHGLFQVPQFSIFFPSKHSQFCGFHSIPGWVKGLGAESVRTFPVPLALPLCMQPWEARSLRRGEIHERRRFNGKVLLVFPMFFSHWYLVGGDWNHGILWLSHILGMSYSQLTNSYFSEG